MKIRRGSGASLILLDTKRNILSFKEDRNRDLIEALTHHAWYQVSFPIHEEEDTPVLSKWGIVKANLTTYIEFS